MTATTTARPTTTTPPRIPLPREHGAWVMLYVPIVLGFVAAPSAQAVPAILLTLAATFAFLAQDAARLAVRRRGGVSTPRWLALWLILAAASAAPLFVKHAAQLVALAGVAALLLAVQALLLRLPAAKRQDRTLWGELLAIPALTLGGPAAALVSGARLEEALTIYAASTAYFASGIFTVKMLLASVKWGSPIPASRRREVSRPHLGYHALLLVAVSVVAVRIGGIAGVLLAAAYAPALVRAFTTWQGLDGRLPPLRRVGIRESILAIWFLILMAVALRLFAA